MRFVVFSGTPQADRQACHLADLTGDGRFNGLTVPVPHINRGNGGRRLYEIVGRESLAALIKARERIYVGLF